MKTQFKRFSKSTISVLLAVCLLFSCMTVGLIATSAAQDDSEAVGSYNNYYIEYNSAGSGTAYFNSSGVAEIVATETGKMYLGFKRNDWGEHGYFGHDSYTISPGTTTWEVYQYNTNWIGLNVTSGKKYTFQLTSEGGTTKFKVTESNNTTKLATPSLKYNNATTTPVDVTGTPSNLTWAAVSNASSYTIYKDGTAVQTGNTSRSYTPSSTGSYTVKAIGNGTTYSDSDASNAIQLNFQKTTTIYIKKGLKNKAGYTMTKAYIWSNSSDKWTGNWSGQAIDTWTESGDYYYKSFTNAYSKFKVILNDGSNQTDDSEESDTGKTYRIDSVDSSGNRGKAVLTVGAPVSYGITYSGSNVTWGSGKPTSAYAGDTVSFTVSANTGYRLKQVKYNDGSDHVLTASSGTYSFTMPAKAVTITATTVKTYSVKLTASTGFATRQYKLDSSGTYTAYTSGTTLTVDTGTDVYFKVTYSTGYQYSSNSGLTVVTANTEFRTGSVTADKTSLSITASKINYTVTLNKNSDAATAGTGSVTATYGDAMPTTSVTMPTRTGYTFEGYYDTSAATGGTQYYTSAGASARTWNKTANTTLYARWSEVTGSANAKAVSTSGGTVKVGTGTAATTVEVPGIGIDSSKSVTATANTYYSFSGWKFSGDNCTHLRYRFGTSGDWLTPVANTTYGTSSNTTIYVKTDGTSGITTSNAVISAQFTANSYSLSTQAKYSTTGASGSYDTIMTYVPYKSAASGTNATGVTVTADATKVEGGYTYQFVNWSCDSGDGTFTSATSASTTFKPKKNGALAIALYKRVYKTTATTNKSSWGTVSIDKEYAVYNETVTITCTPAAGIIKTIVAYDTTNSRVVKSWKRNSSGSIVVDQAQQNSANQFTQVGLSGIAGSIYSFIKDAGEALGAADDSTAVGDDPLTFNMPAGAVSVTATYEEYVGTSEYIYHGRNTSGQAVSGYENEVMSEGVINGQKYAYYNVSGRGSVGYDQIFYVSKAGSYTDRWVYFTDKGGTYADWANHDPTVYFYNSSGAVGTAWPGAKMTWVSGEGSNVDKNWKLEIPDGATGVIFTNGKSGGDFKQTQDMDLTNTNGSYYPSGYSDNKYTVTQWTTPGTNSGIIAGTDYYWDTDVYKDQWYTGGFSNHNVNNDHNYAKPKDGNSQSFNECKDDYYIILLYPNTSYTFGLNGHDAETKTTGSKPWVLWSKQLPGQSSVDVPTVKVYAKDGTIRRDNDSPERNDRTYSSFEQYANTFVYSDSGYATHIGTRSSHDGQSSEGSTGYNGYTYDYVAKFNKGDTLYIKTVLKDDTFMNKYYLAAYSINGKTYALHTTAESDTRTVTEAFTVPEDWEDKYVEITPIYFLRDTEQTNTITFYIEGYDETVMNAGWGNTPFVYPFYQDANFNYVANINNAFGGYPGQPMVFYKGNYYIQLPKQITTTISTGQTGQATIKGVTLGNGYWDDIHLITGEVSSHFQTYDYDDLYKIYNEKDNADHIICAFKYRTKKNNDEPASMSSATAANYNKTNGNGWEVLTNYYGEPVDVFGNVLTGSAKTLAESIMADPTSADTAAVVHAISQDYKSNSAGDYATEWVIYNTSGNKVVATSGGKTSIVPSALAINANTTGTGELTANFDKYDNATKAFKSIYTALYNDTNVRNKPAVVTYEKSIYGGGDKADRCDARWYFSQKNAPITATTRIEYTDDGRTWNTDTYTSGTGTGSTTGTKAYFTGRASTATDIPDDTSDVSGTNTTTLGGHTGDGYYTFKAENAGQYQFVGWYLLRDNYQNISTRSSYAADAPNFPSHAEMTKNGDIFVARFKKTATGTFDIYHEVHPQTTGYGNVSVSAVVKDSGGTQVASYPASGTTDHVTIPNTYIRSGEGYKVVATFTADPYHTSNFDAFYATVQDLLQGYEDYDFIDSIQINADATGGTATVTYNVDKMFSMASGSPVQTVTNVTHYSKFSLKTDLTYSLEYTFNTRYYGTKLYKYTNVKFTEQELRSYFLDQITDPNCDHIKLDKQFVKAKAPFESNFREDLTWVVDNVRFNNDNDPTIGYLTATQVKTKWANVMVYDFDNSGEMETTTMVAPIEKLFNASIKTKPSYSTTEEEAQAIENWSVDKGQMYYPTRSSYTHDGTTTPLYIDHWDIYQLDSFTYNTENNLPKMKDDGFNLDVDISKSVLVAQAYSKRFNYVAYEDYAIVPVYTTENVDIQEESDKRKDSSATLLTLTRNQWNANAEGNTDSSSYRDGADRVYVDIMLNYNYSVEIDGKPTNILLNSTGNNIKVGFIVRSYTWVNEQKSYGKAQYVLVDKSQINEKNRLEYCFGFKNNENNRRAGLYYEFKPFIVDTANQTGSEGCDVTIDNHPYKALYSDDDVKILDQVSFYQLGRL